jgi:hypothetical protein
LCRLFHILKNMKPFIHIKLSNPFSATLTLKILAPSLKANDATYWLALFCYALRSDVAVSTYLRATDTAKYNGVTLWTLGLVHMPSWEFCALCF